MTFITKTKADKLKSLFLTAMLLIGTMVAWAGNIEGIDEFGNFSAGGIKYKINKYDSTVIVNQVGSIEYVSIPKRVTAPDSITYNVSSIGGQAFFGNNWVRWVEIPNTVTEIEDEAFYGCSRLKHVNIPNSVTHIGKFAFAQCSALDSLDIPNSVTEIGELAFYECSGLKKVTIPNSVTDITNGTFLGCDSLTTVNIPNSVTEIGELAFAECHNLTSITIPESVAIISDAAFAECSGLTSIHIPESVMHIGGQIFRGCNHLKSITVDSKNQYYASPGNCNAIITKERDFGVTYNDTIYYPQMSNMLIAGCNSSIIPESVTRIGDLAFLGCNGLETVKIPNSVVEIGNYAFYDCSNLTTVDIPNSVKIIGVQAFAGCNALDSIIIPSSVYYIGGGAFSGCSHIEVASDSYYFTSPDNCNAVIETYYQLNILVAGCAATTIPDYVTSIGDYALAKCGGLTSVTIPSSVTSIGIGAFAGCNSLTSITVDGDNKFFDSRHNCNAIINTNNNELVAGCAATTIPESVTRIGDLAFWGCSGLETVTISGSVTHIGEQAFARCDNLTTVTCLAKVPPTLGNDCFDADCYQNATLTVPLWSVFDYKFKEGWNNFLKLSVPDQATPATPSGSCSPGMPR